MKLSTSQSGDNRGGSIKRWRPVIITSSSFQSEHHQRNFRVQDLIFHQFTNSSQLSNDIQLKDIIRFELRGERQS